MEEPIAEKSSEVVSEDVIKVQDVDDISIKNKNSDNNHSDDTVIDTENPEKRDEHTKEEEILKTEQELEKPHDNLKPSTEHEESINEEVKDIENDNSSAEVSVSSPTNLNTSECAKKDDMTNNEIEDCESEERASEPVQYVNSGSPIAADGNEKCNEYDKDVIEEDPIKNSNDIEMKEDTETKHEVLEDEKSLDRERESEPMNIDNDTVSDSIENNNTTTKDVLESSVENNEIEENIKDSSKEKNSATENSVSVDLFDTVRNSEPSTSEKSPEKEINTNNDSTNIDDDDDNNKDTEADHHNDDIENDAESVAEDGVDDLERGKGADEEMCLLPEREISEADKERAIAAASIEETDKTKIDDDSSKIDETNDKQIESPEDLNESVNDENDSIIEVNENDNEAIAINNDVDGTISGNVIKDNEIKEVLTELTAQKCVKCGNEKLCEYKFNSNNETTYICSIDCVNSLREDNPNIYTLNIKKIAITLVTDTNQKCIKCAENKICKYRLKQNKSNEYEYLCDTNCLNEFLAKNDDRFIVKRKRYLIDETQETDKETKCIHCSETKICKYVFKQDDDELHICHEDCLNLLLKEQPDRIRLKRRTVRVRDLPKRVGSGSATLDDGTKESETVKIIARTDAEAETARLDRERSFIRRCAHCMKTVQLSDTTIYWETLDFCDELCLGKYQNVIGSKCTTCNSAVTAISLGKYCVRFGYDIKQFCRSMCLDEYKKALKVCSYCQKDISGGREGFLASVGDKGQFKDFCAPSCMKKYDEMCNHKKSSAIATCAVCSNLETVKVEVILDSRDHNFCSNPCFSAFKFVNNVYPDQCNMCQKFFERKSFEKFTIYQDSAKQLFCSKICMNLFIITNRKIVPCNWCKVKKYNFDMIKKLEGAQAMMMCSLNCLTLSEVSMNAITKRQLKCDQCKNSTTPQYHLTMSDATIRNFCTYQCVMSFQGQFSKTPLVLSGEIAQLPINNTPVPTGLPKRVPKVFQLPQKTTITKIPPVPVISNVTSLATGTMATRSTRKISKTPQLQPIPLHDLKVNLERVNIDLVQATLNSKRSPSNLRKSSTQQSETPSVSPSPSIDMSMAPLTPPPPPEPITKVEYKTQIVTLPPEPKLVSNMSTMCKPIAHTKGVTCRPTTVSVECQTEDHLEHKIIIPIPIPIYIPQPMYMYSLPTPIPVPFPLPIPIPIFIPTTRNSAQGIMKEIKKIQDKMPTDPFEAELLMMAEMVAGDKKRNESDSGSDIETPVEDDFATETIENSNAFGEDMLQIALKMASEYDEPAVDLESAMPSNTITPNPHTGQEIVEDPAAIHHHHMLMMEQQQQQQHNRQAQQVVVAGRGGRKRTTPAQVRNNRNALPTTPVPNKRSRRSDIIIPQIMEPTPEPPREPAEKADANMCLKFTFGVNAWKQWVITKNSDLEKSSIRRKPFKSDLLQLTADELNYSLCLFVKEVRKPNGTDYAPDTIYYLVLGIQQYLYEHGRIDNIFTDPYYEKFTDCLDEVAKKFSVLYNDSQYIVTRVEEEHLWECKQLGAHSPHVLLSTLMFFNTKHFNLTTVEEHMQLSFSHIMKHWKRNPNQPGAAKAAGSRNVLLRFYPPQSSLEGNSRKKKVYEQQENEENPLRCPVKLYEFYLSKCPESVKTRNDVFYLQPERSCVPDSPVWYSTQALSREALSKMLHRVKMVKEINIALLTS